jgi:hypothetical protein
VKPSGDVMAGWRAPLVAGALVFAAVLATGDRLLRDPDILWQATLGRWIVAHRAVPVADMFSFTMHGAPWRSSQWLSLVIYGEVQAYGGWTANVVVAALAVGAAFALLARFLLARLGVVPVAIILPVAAAIAWPQLFARPHVLALPVAVAWMAALLSAAERRTSPPLAALALMTLWVNLHGGFVLGLALIVPVALDAVAGAERDARPRLAARWLVFAGLALAASWISPYGWHSLGAARAVLDLGEALQMLGEWRPLDLGRPGALQIAAMAALALMFATGARLPPFRALLVVGLLFLALAHRRNADVFALLVPMIVAAPLTAQFPRLRAADANWPRLAALAAFGLIAIAMVAAAGRGYRPPAYFAPAGAVAALRQEGAKRVFNDYNFGGYLIAQGVPVFIDGRAELYGADVLRRYDSAVRLRRPDDFLGWLDAHRIDATLLSPRVPAARLLDHMDGWRKVYVDNVAVVHVRDADAPAAREPRIVPSTK